MLGGFSTICNFNIEIKRCTLKHSVQDLNYGETRVGKKAGNTHISQDGGKYWEIRLIFNLQI